MTDFKIGDIIKSTTSTSKGLEMIGEIISINKKNKKFLIKVDQQKSSSEGWILLDEEIEGYTDTYPETIKYLHRNIRCWSCYFKDSEKINQKIKLTQILKKQSSD